MRFFRSLRIRMGYPNAQARHIRNYALKNSTANLMSSA
ncbi:hypothetical protein BSU04_34430 [Caballeronia sordidicola]|uniref:Uncharacterized protein n=1 Tax=Caballeronia sordidicola TaxID=196367 RepID=A0A226WS16_CABSO|nr:hypothetical protein BSU04_34430 [Caballeronia sordidicola]